MMNTKNVAIITGALLLAGVGGLVYFHRRSESAKNSYAKDEQNKIGIDAAATIASKLIAAFDPYAYWVGTDEEAVFSALQEMNTKKVSMSAVAISYYKQTKERDFHTDLRSELTNEEYEKALTIIKKNAQILQPSATTLPPKEIFSQAVNSYQKFAYANIETTLYKIVGNATIAFATVKKGQFVGQVTGKKNGDFIELQTKINGVIYLFWANNNQLILGDFTKNFKDLNTTHQIVTNY